MKKGNNINSQTTQAFQLGGTVQLPGFTGVQTTQPTAPTTGYRPYVQPVQAASSQFGPQFTGVQYTGATGTTNFPTFADTVGRNPGQYDELRTYVNDAGQTLRIPFKNGQPIYPIPYGYKYQAEEAVKPTDTSTVPTTVVGQDDRGGDGDGGRIDVSGAVQGPAGGPTGVAGLTSAFSGLGSYLSGEPAQAQPYGGTTLDSLNAMGMVSRDSKGNVIGPAVTDFSNNLSGVTDAFGVYGSEPINVSAALSVMTGNIPGALAAVRSRDSGVGMFGQAAPTGHGAYSTDVLEAYARGTLSKAQQNELGIALNQNQAFARAQVQRAIGTPITGLIGYKPGSISPITGTPVNSKGRVVNFQGSTTGVDPGFASMGDWMDALEVAKETGYWGGPKSAKEVGVMTNSARAKYNGWAAASGHSVGGEGPATGPGAEAAAKGSSPGVSSPSGQGRSDYSGGYPGGTPAGTPSSSNDSPGAAKGGYGNTGGYGEDPGFDGGGGGGSQGGGPGNAGSGSSCFAAGTKFFMKDGSLKNIEDIKIGDVLQRGGKVRTTIVGDGLYENWYLYGNTKVTGTHTVFENGTWKRVENSDKAIPTDKDEFIYTLVNEKHRLIAEDGVMYGDYDEVDNLDIEDGLLEMMNLQDAVEEAA
jgi:hypothetical protein